MVADWAESQQFLHTKGLVLDRASQNLFLDYLCKDLFAALRLLTRRAKGDFGEDRYADRFPKITATTAADPGLTAWMLFWRWGDAKKPASATVDRWRGVFLKLQEDFPEHSAAALTADQMQAWLLGLINDQRSAGTVRDGWLNACRVVFAWAKRQRLITNNPFAEVDVTVPGKNRTRDKTFSEDEIRTILSAALAIGAPKTKTDAAKRWVPWLLAYTGARAGEITQLRGSDVTKWDGIAAIKITPDAGSVKNRQARTVPLHQELIKQGFPAWANTNGKGPLFY